MGHAVLCDQLEDLAGIDLAQAHIDAGSRRDGPRKTPAVAVEHRQRPEIDRMLAEIGRQDVADGVEIGAAVVGHHALGVARGARGIAQRDGVPFVLGRSCGEAFVALRQRVLVFDLADPLSSSKSRIVDIDDKRFWSRHQGQRLRYHAGKFRVDQDDFRAAMIELEGDRGGIKPDVERVEHSAGHRDRKMYLVHCRDVRQHRRDRIAVSDVSACEERGKAPATRIGLRPGEGAAFVHGAEMAGIDGGGARQEAQRRQRNKIGGCLVQTDIVLALLTVHRSSSL